MKTIRSITLSLATIVIAACSEQPAAMSKHIAAVQSFPNMKLFREQTSIRGVERSNADIFEEFIDYAFALESGETLTVLSRFEGPIRVALINSHSRIIEHDLDILVARLQKEAGIPIRRVADPTSANIVIEMITKRQLNRTAPNAACIVVPRMSSWTEFRKNRFNRRSDWTSLYERKRVAIFIPGDISFQDVRDCLHEELAQALGPLNDLYRVSDSVYNDDNFHIILTSYDMLLLQIFYAPEFRSGMIKDEVAALLPAILRRLNPKGIGRTPRQLQETPKAWKHAIETALGMRKTTDVRTAAAARAVRLAKRARIDDHRLGFSFFTRARAVASTDPIAAVEDYTRAYAIFLQAFGPNDIHTAHVALQLASFSVSVGKFRQALQYIQPSLVGAKLAQNGRLMLSLLAMKAAIYEKQGRLTEAEAIYQEAIGWGHYGVHAPSDITARLQLISDLFPKTPLTEG